MNGFRRFLAWACGYQYGILRDRREARRRELDALKEDIIRRLSRMDDSDPAAVRRVRDVIRSGAATLEQLTGTGVDLPGRPDDDTKILHGVKA